MKVRLGDVLELNPRESIVKNTIARKISMTDLKPFTRDIPTFSYEKYSGGAKFRNNDILLARITPCLENGKTALVNILDKDEVAFGSTEYFVLRAKKGLIDPYYLYYLSISQDFRNVVIKSMTGTSGRQRAQKDAILEYKLDLPNIQEQQSIAKQLRALDDKIRLNKQINDNLLDVAQLIFNSMFPNVNYGTQTIGELTKNFDKFRKPLSKKQRIEIQGNYRYIGATSVNDYISKYNFDGIYLLLAEDGSVQDNNGFPILQYVFGKFWPNNHTHVLQGNNISTEWLYLFFRQHKVSELVTGAVQPKISQSNLNKISITAPTEEEKEIFSTRTDNIFSLIRQNELQSTKLLMLKNLLLSKYF
ncbi:restriction endonuclease subunit S [Lactobacillus delbrueckii subsp. bulgaricus]